MEQKTVGECFYQIRNGANIKQGIANGGYPITRIETIANDQFNRNRMGYAGITDIGKYEGYVLEDGDLLMSHINSVQYLGRTVLYRRKNNESIIHGMNLLGLKANREIIEPAYANYLFSSQSFKKQISRITKKSVNQASFTVADLKKLTLIVPSLPIQYEIISILDKLRDIITIRQRQLQKLDKLVKARFVEMFGDLKTNPKGWTVVPFPEFAEIDGDMTTDYEKYADYPHIGIDSIEKNTGALKGFRTVREDGVISGKYIFTPRHIIYSKIRPNLNKVALPNFNGLCSADAYPILPNPCNCNRVFLAAAMRSEYFLEYILQFSLRTNLPKVNRKEISGFRMPLPPLELQKQFAAFVEQTDKSKIVVQKALDEVQLLFDSLMQQYFS